jgi:ribosomal protein S18
MSKNKFAKYVIALMGALILVGCDVYAEPTDYEDPLLSNLVTELEKITWPRSFTTRFATPAP